MSSKDLVKTEEIDYDDLEDIHYISRGNFGNIFRATYFGTEVAVKQLLDVGVQAMEKYIEREIANLQSLRHPHIVQFMGICKHDNDLFIVTEFVQGGDLYDKLRDPKLKMGWKLRVNIAVETAQAICYLHSRGVIHRDLKSQNLLVDSNYKVKICDFGFARAQDPKEYMTMCGTDEWMAPEIILGDKYNEKADVFSFGMILTELITRRDPPARTPGNAYAFDEAGFRKTVPEDCPPKLVDIAVSCLSFYPEDRPNLKATLKLLKDLEKGLPDDSSGVKNLAEELEHMTVVCDDEDDSAKKGEEKKKKEKKKEGENGEKKKRRHKDRKDTKESKDKDPSAKKEDSVKKKDTTPRKDGEEKKKREKTKSATTPSAKEKDSSDKKKSK